MVAPDRSHSHCKLLPYEEGPDPSDMDPDVVPLEGVQPQPEQLRDGVGGHGLTGSGAV